MTSAAGDGGNYPLTVQSGEDDDKAKPDVTRSQQIRRKPKRVLGPDEFRAAGAIVSLRDTDARIDNKITFDGPNLRGASFLAKQLAGKRRGDEEITKELRLLVASGKIMQKDDQGNPQRVDPDAPGLPSLALMNDKGIREIGFMTLLPTDLWPAVTSHAEAMDERNRMILGIASAEDSLVLLEKEVADATAQLSSATDDRQRLKLGKVIDKLNGAIHRREKQLEADKAALEGREGKEGLQAKVEASEANLVAALRQKFSGGFVHPAAPPPRPTWRELVVNHGPAVVGAAVGLYCSAGFASMALRDHTGLSPEDSMIIRIVAAVFAILAFVGATAGAYYFDRDHNRPAPQPPHGFV